MMIHKWNKIDAIFDGLLDDIYRQVDYCDVFYVPGQGYAILNHKPKYAPYHRLGLAEIQDVFVLPEYRGRGVASALIHYCEGQTDRDAIGISVPVSADYGIAQRLYIKMGYIPDGHGVTYDRQPVSPHTAVKCDENLCLMLVKDLN